MDTSYGCYLWAVDEFDWLNENLLLKHWIMVEARLCCYLEATWEDFAEGTERNDYLAWYGAYVIWRERNGLYLLQKQVSEAL